MNLKSKAWHFTGSWLSCSGKKVSEPNSTKNNAAWSNSRGFVKNNKTFTEFLEL